MWLILNANMPQNALRFEKIRLHVQKNWIRLTVGYIECLWMGLLKYINKIMSLKKYAASISNRILERGMATIRSFWATVF
jgi:hypothetical protein